MRTTRTLALTLAVPALALTLAACGGNGGTHNGSSSKPSATAGSTYGPAATGPHNDADVAFATEMIPHHAQAVEMATMALEKATNATVKQLATAIQSAQDPEIQKMSGWLVGWGQPVPDTSSTVHGGGHSMSGGTGMMTEAQMTELENASGAAFDKLWVEMMTEHHEGAVSMSRAELADGENSEAKALAQQIITAQTKEIATMVELAKTR